MFDMLSALHPRGGVTFSGSYYPRRPNAPDDDHETFEYEMVDPTDRRYRMAFGNLEVSKGVTATIRVSDDIPFKVKEYVWLQDERLYIIESAMKDYATAPKEVFRYFKTSPQVSWVLRCIEVDAPWSKDGI